MIVFVEWKMLLTIISKICLGKSVPLCSHFNKNVGPKN